MRALQKCLLSLVTFAVGLGLVEGANRLRLSASGAPYDSAATLAYLRREIASIDQLGADIVPDKTDAKSVNSHKVMHPYTAFDIRPALRKTAADTAYFKTANAERAFDILLFGGSVANGFGRDAGSVLVKALKRDERFKGRPIRLLRYARASFKQPQQAISLTYLLACGFRPDAVINLDGFNEVAIANTNNHFNINPLQPAISQWGPHTQSSILNSALMGGMHSLRILREETTSLATRALHSGMMWSSLVGNFAQDRIRTGRNQQAELQRRLIKNIAGSSNKSAGKYHENAVVRGPDWNQELDAVLDVAVACWKDGSITMDAICKRRSIFYFHALQPTLHSPGAKPATPMEIESGAATTAWMQAAQLGYPKLQIAGAQLTADGVAFFDASQVFSQVEETLYHDACHFSKEGQTILAEEIAQEFVRLYKQD